jgi:FixJ family two-component response regulator
MVFVIDDDPSVRRGLANLLTALGFRVKAFSSAGAFLDRALNESPACLLLDVNLPDQSGFELFDTSTTFRHSNRNRGARCAQQQL